MVKIDPNREEMLDPVAIKWSMHRCGYMGAKANTKVLKRDTKNIVYLDLLGMVGLRITRTPFT